MGGSGHAKFALPKDIMVHTFSFSLLQYRWPVSSACLLTLCNLAPPDKRLFFTPFVLESTGYLHEDAVNFLNLLAKRTAEIWKISETGVYQYFVKSLSCVLQKANASNINKRYHEIITGVHALDYTTAYRATYLENMIDSVIHRVI